MIIKLLMNGVAFLWIIATIALTIWWRSKFTYVYFGSGSMMHSWAGTIVGAMVVAGILVSIIGAPVAWIDEHCPYLPDIIVVGLIIRHFIKKKDTTETDATDDDEKAQDGDAIANEEVIESTDDKFEVEDDMAVEGTGRKLDTGKTTMHSMDIEDKGKGDLKVNEKNNVGDKK